MSKAGSPRKVFFVGSVSSPHDQPLLGGQRVTLEQARTLRQWGYDAYVVTAVGRLGRLANIGRSVNPIFMDYRTFARVIDPARDVVVLAGRYAQIMDRVPGDHKVIFSQGAFVTLSSLPLEDGSERIWRNPSLRALMCVSEGNAEILHRLNSSCPLLVVPNRVKLPDNQGAARDDRLLYPDLRRPEKNAIDTRVVLQMLYARAGARGGAPPQFVQLARLPYAQVQEYLASSSVLLFLGINEGLPLLVLEAMAAGCIVLGYRRRPLSDLLHQRCLFEIGSLCDLADTADAILQSPGDWADVRLSLRARAAEFSEERHLARLREAWDRIESEVGAAQAAPRPAFAGSAGPHNRHARTRAPLLPDI